MSGLLRKAQTGTQDEKWAVGSGWGGARHVYTPRSGLLVSSSASVSA